MIVVAIMFFLSISIIAFTFVYEKYLTSDTQQIAQRINLPIRRLTCHQQRID